MKIRKAVITAAGQNQDRLPLQRFVDIDGVEKSALRIIAEEVVAAGVEQICVVVRQGNQRAYAEGTGDYSRSDIMHHFFRKSGFLSCFAG
jgi:UTP--glucose-1-phosphate uridylyltransferase